MLPFKLFLFSYAILGPLHYLTEINWLRNKNYFIPGEHKNPVKILLVLSCLICIVPVIHGFSISEFGTQVLQIKKSGSLNGFLNVFSKYTNTMILSGFICGIIFLIFKSWNQRIIGSIAAILFCILLSKLPFYRIVFIVLLPTFIHVYLFTGAFMLFGAIKSNSKAGYISVLLLLAVPFALILIDVDTNNIIMTEYIKNGMVKSHFLYVLEQTADFIGTNGSSSFKIMSSNGIKLQIFLAFAYTYHYLNWFAKTSVIKWHKVEKNRLFASVILWIAFISLYIYDFHLGFIVSFVLSFIHVLFEFPLNAKTFEFIGKWVYQIMWAKKN